MNPGFVNGAATAAFAAIVTSGTQAVAKRLSDAESVRFGDLHEVSAEQGEEYFAGAKAAALQTDHALHVDPEQISFDNRYALVDPKTDKVSYYTDYSAAAKARSAGFGILGGETVGKQITIYRTAFAADINAINFGGSRFETFGFGSIPRGMHSGVFVIGHEIGHLRTSREIGANFTGLKIYQDWRGY